MSLLAVIWRREKRNHDGMAPDGGCVDSPRRLSEEWHATSFRCVLVEAGFERRVHCGRDTRDNDIGLVGTV